MDFRNDRFPNTPDGVSLDHPQIRELADLASAFPDLRIVVNHVGGVLGIGAYRGKRDEVFSRWQASIEKADLFSGSAARCYRLEAIA